MAQQRKLQNGTLFTHREGVLYAEHCRVVASDGLLSLVRPEGALEKHYSVPHANVCVLLLGPGTSVTHQAARKMAEQGMMVGFVGGGGTPLFLASQSEYRPTEYCQAWVQRWADLTWRLGTAKEMALARCGFVESCYRRRKIADEQASGIIEAYRADIQKATSNAELLGYEAAFAKRLYAFHSKRVAGQKFKRTPQGDDATNGFIDSGNYLAYGLAASVLWVLGIPHSFAVNHGTTRRGALVFDLADIIKDAVLLPIAFDAASAGLKDSEHRALCLAALDDSNTMKMLFECMKKWCE